MNRKLMKTAIRLCAVIVLLGWASLAIAGKPTSTTHPVKVTVIDAGNSIQSDSPTLSNASYTDGMSGIEARIWDFTNFSHLHFEVTKGRKASGRFLRLSIPGVVLPTVCEVGRLKPNQNANSYNFYDLLPIGESTDVASTNPLYPDPDRSNFGGTFTCGRSAYQPSVGWIVTYPECIVIEHTGVGYWRMTAPAGCIAVVTFDGESEPRGSFPVPFQVELDQLDVNP
jgi:hypothetical protein